MIDALGKFPLRLDSVPYRSVELEKVNEVRSLSSAPGTNLLLLTTYNELMLFDTEFNAVVKRIRRLSNLRSASLSACGKMILAHFTENTLRLICTKTGRDIGQLVGVPHSAMKFTISQNGNRIIGGNNKTLCLWRTSNCELVFASNNWTNMNCSAINDTGDIFAVGTFNGQIFLLKCLSNNRCSQIQYNKHDKCIMIMHWSGKRLASVSYDKILLIMEFNEPKGQSDTSQKQLCFMKYQMEAVPKSISSFNDLYFFAMAQGLYIYCLKTNTRLHVEGDMWYPRKNGDGLLELVKSKLVSLHFHSLTGQT